MAQFYDPPQNSESISAGGFDLPTVDGRKEMEGIRGIGKRLFIAHRRAEHSAWVDEVSLFFR